MPPSTEIKKAFSAARILGSGDDRVTLSENELFCLLSRCCHDLSITAGQASLPYLAGLPIPEYYRIPLTWFRDPLPNCPSIQALVDSLATCVAHDADFRLYFENLAALHKRRLKYQRILSSQPRPTMNQIGSKSLLEFGWVEDELLASWLLWRKWIFDIDGRSAQETGYLFEPVLASCLGGDAVNHKNSPVKRLNERGESTGEGRQIDCYDGVNQLAYEFKLRITNAASGQGRWGEELSFPREARAAGLKPVLIVLDPTPSRRLEELIGVFKDCDGLYFLGVEAWKHMDEKAGKTMAKYLETYIRPPLAKMAAYEVLGPQSLHLIWAETEVTIRGAEESVRIPRAKRPDTLD